jgi:hypothetical protein
MAEPVSLSAMVLCYGVTKLATMMFSAGLKAGSDWVVDRSCVAAVQKIYDLTHDSKGNKIDHRRKPWCTMRRFCTAYESGDKDKFNELRASMRELKEALTADEQEKLAEAIGEGGNEAVAMLCAALDNTP